MSNDLFEKFIFLDTQNSGKLFILKDTIKKISLKTEKSAIPVYFKEIIPTLIIFYESIDSKNINSVYLTQAQSIEWDSKYNLNLPELKTLILE